MDLDPRTRILHDLGNLITQKRAEGFRPILMMDANDDWLQTSSKAFTTFVEDMRLVDPYYEKFKTSGLTGTTYARGSRRIDFIFVDSTILPAIKRIGTLGLHEGIISDHIMLYMDCDERLLFGGIINRPVMSPGREFVIEHADKCKKIIDLFQKLVSEKKFKERVEKLRDEFAVHGADEANVKCYHTLDTEIKECLLSCARKVAKKKFGYQRSPHLTTQDKHSTSGKPYSQRNPETHPWAPKSSTLPQDAVQTSKKLPQ